MIQKKKIVTEIDIITVEINEKGQYICPHCRKPMTKVMETQYDYITWEWNEQKKTYIKAEPNGDCDKPTCGECDEKLDRAMGFVLGY